jgi:hypothetical protein
MERPMPVNRRLSRFPRRSPSPASPHVCLLLVGDPAEVEAVLDAAARAGLHLPVEAVPHVDAAWDRLNRRGVYTGREQAPALLLIGRPERAGVLPFLRRLRADVLLRPVPVVLLTKGGAPSGDIESARVSPILYYPRPETAAGRRRLARELAALLPEF